MIEGRSGGSGRGTRRELWAPPDRGSAHRRIAGLYRVPTLDPSRSLRRPRISFPPPLPQGKILPHPSARSAYSSPQNGGPKGKMIVREERGIWAGHSKRIVGPT